MSQQIAVLQRTPTQFKSGGDFMRRQELSEWLGSALVEEHPHSHNLERARGVLEDDPSLVQTHARKPSEEF
jgi:hypothetical protein